MNIRYIHQIVSTVFLTFALLVSFGVDASQQEIWSFPKPGSHAQLGLRHSVTAEKRQLPASLGNITSFIVGGSTALQGEFPEYSMLLVDGGDGYLYFLCGGTLITSNQVLTAAHCTKNIPSYQLWVVPGYYSDQSVNLDDFYEVASKVIHPDYGHSGLSSDISILDLNSNVSGTKAKIFGGSGTLDQYLATVVGKGLLKGIYGTLPKTLQKVHLPIVSNQVCASKWGSNIHADMICAGGTTSGGVGACSGDSGGPLFVSYEGERVQAGIVSWGHQDCAQPGFYDVYARTSKLISFIRANAPDAEIVGVNQAGLPAILSLLLLE